MKPHHFHPIFTLALLLLSIPFISSQNSQVLPHDGGLQKVSLNHHEKVPFFYYSSAENQEIPLKITLSAFLATEMDSAFKEKHPIKIRYWPDEEEISGSGQEISFEILNQEAQDRDLSLELLIKSSSIGKYMIQMENLWRFPVTFSITAGSILQFLGLSGENLEFSDEFGLSTERKYDIFLTRKEVNWYYWLYSCYQPVDLKFGNELVTIPFEGSFTHKEKIGDSEIKERIRDVTISSDEKLGWHRFFMYSALIKEERFWDYEAKNEKLEMSLSYDYKDSNSSVAIEFDPVEFSDPDPADKVDYNVKICEVAEDGQETQITFCDDQMFYCQNLTMELSVNHKERMKVEFSNVKNGYNYVTIKAFVKHQGQVIRFVPYAVRVVEIRSRFWFNVGVFILGGIVVWVFWKKCGKQCFEKMKEDKRIVELSDIGKKRDYDQLGEVEEGRSPGGNEGEDDD